MIGTEVNMDKSVEWSWFKRLQKWTEWRIVRQQFYKFKWQHVNDVAINNNEIDTKFTNSESI